jgi:hypothetical protein
LRDIKEKQGIPITESIRIAVLNYYKKNSKWCRDKTTFATTKYILKR